MTIREYGYRDSMPCLREMSENITPVSLVSQWLMDYKMPLWMYGDPLYADQKISRFRNYCCSEKKHIRHIAKNPERFSYSFW